MHVLSFENCKDFWDESECSDRLNKKSKTANSVIPISTKNNEESKKIPSAVICLDVGLSAYK